MSEPTEPRPDGTDFADKHDPMRDAVVIGVLLLMLAGLFGAFYWSSLRIGDGSFAHRFQGCDADGRCATIKIYAPGFDYRWTYGSVALEVEDPRRGRLAPLISEDLLDAEAVIAAGLASHEGGDDYNRRLSACRSKYLAQLIEDAQAVVNSDAPLYRVALGRYQPSDGEYFENDDSAIERMIVMAFVLDQDPGLDLEQALRQGLTAELPLALEAALEPLQRQLDFRNYACWSDEFAVTENSELRQICYTEPSPNPTAFCSDF